MRELILAQIWMKFNPNAHRQHVLYIHYIQYILTVHTKHTHIYLKNAHTDVCIHRLSTVFWLKGNLWKADLSLFFKRSAQKSQHILGLRLIFLTCTWHSAFLFPPFVIPLSPQGPRDKWRNPLIRTARMMTVGSLYLPLSLSLQFSSLQSSSHIFSRLS